MYYAATYHPDGRIERTYGASLYYDLMYQVGLSDLPHAESTNLLRHDLHYWDGAQWANRPDLPDITGPVVTQSFPAADIEVLYNGTSVYSAPSGGYLEFQLEDPGLWTIRATNAFPYKDRTYEIVV